MKTMLDVDELVFSPPELGCVLYLPGPSGGGSKIYDRSPYGNHGTITGAIWKRLPSGLWYLDYDGSDDYTDCGTILTSVQTELTVLGWFNPDTVTSDDGMLRIGINTANGKLVLVVYNNRINAGINGAYNDVGFVITANIWRHFALQYKAPVLNLFINGKLEATNGAVETSIDFSASNDGVLNIGRYNLRYDGSVALVEVSLYALSALEIQNHFQQEKHLFGVG